ncbi:hypothetical protein LDENG_00013480 [Lucifuga dentata]|nr:hypothetical protein LDENG_00013480 [Lucifuga dentata]
MWVPSLIWILHFTNLAKDQDNINILRYRRSSSVSRLCQAGCATCSTLNGCLSCKPRLFFHMELDGMKQRGICLSSCPHGHFGMRSPHINTCTRCKEDCASCFSENFCTRCHPGRFLFRGKCENSCPKRLTANTALRECTDAEKTCIFFMASAISPVRWDMSLIYSLCNASPKLKYKCGFINIAICASTEEASKGSPVSMAGYGENDCSAKTVASSKLIEEAGDTCTTDSSFSSTTPECAICLQSCIHPEVPEDFLERPVLLSPEELKLAAAGVSRGRGMAGSSLGEYAWYYEGRNGWWQYDERTSCELEEAFAKGRKSTEMLIAGFLYVADLENMVQYRRNEHGRRRKIKRDVVGIPKKGVAGLRLDPEPLPIPVLPVVSAAAVTERVSSADGADAAGQSQSMTSFGSVVSVPPFQLPTVLGGHLTSRQSPSPLMLEESFSQLLISQPEGEEVEADDRPLSQMYESASGSSESEDERQEWDRGRPELMPRQRHRLTGRPLRESQPDRMPPRGGPSNPALNLRSRSPDGQCTVTEV